MPLTDLAFHNTKVSDLVPLKDLPLSQLWCDFKPERDAAILGSIKTLETINGKPAAEFWKDVAAAAKPPVDDAWLKQVAALPAEKQVDAVVAELKKCNPGFDGQATPRIDAGVVTGLEFFVDNVTDISPVRALPQLKTLSCKGSSRGKGRLADLSPLKGMKLTWLSCQATQVSDLSPLKSMPVSYLNCDGTQVSDLSLLNGMLLQQLLCGYTRVSDLSPLKDMKLTGLNCNHTPVSDLSPLKDMPLTVLNCVNTKVSDLSLLKDMPLKELICDFEPKRDAEILRSIKTLETINDKPAKEVLAAARRRDRSASRRRLGARRSPRCRPKSRSMRWPRS